MKDIVRFLVSFVFGFALFRVLFYTQDGNRKQSRHWINILIATAILIVLIVIFWQ
jgi:hypothetical protein